MKFVVCALRVTALLLALILGMALCLFAQGCRITPHFVEPSGHSLDAGNPNSGVIANLLVGTNAAPLYAVTPLWAERYTNLVRGYGNRCNPPLTTPRWITPTNGYFIVTSDAMADFMLMNILSLQHQQP